MMRYHGGVTDSELDNSFGIWCMAWTYLICILKIWHSLLNYSQIVPLFNLGWVEACVLRMHVHVYHKYCSHYIGWLYSFSKNTVPLYIKNGTLSASIHWSFYFVNVWGVCYGCYHPQSCKWSFATIRWPQ
jgi:hypothetical protein